MIPIKLYKLKSTEKSEVLLVITFFNRKKLLVDISSEEIANIREKLEANEIKYNLNTKRNSNILLDIIHSDMAARAKLPYSYTEEKMKYYYVIYVRKKDYAKAKKLCS